MIINENIGNFQYCSDLRIGMNKIDDYYEIISPVSDNLILAGDICEIDYPKLNDFLFWCCDNFEKIFYIIGNHEYYGSNIGEPKNKLNSINIIYYIMMF